MVVGVLQFELFIHGATSLKDKRRVVRSLKDRLHREHMVAVAEIGALDKHNLALLAVACVGMDGARVGQTLDRVSNKLRGMTDAEAGQIVRELLAAPVMGTRDGEESVGEEDMADELAREMLEHAHNDTDPRENPGEQPGDNPSEKTDT